MKRFPMLSIPEFRFINVCISNGNTLAMSRVSENNNRDVSCGNSRAHRIKKIDSPCSNFVLFFFSL